MRSKPKSNSVVSTSYADGIWSFSVAGVGTLALHRDQISPEVLERALVEGMSDRIADKAAKSRDPKTGIPASPVEKSAAMQSLIEHYQSGTPDWTLTGAGGGGRSLTVEAIARVKGIAYDVAEAFVAQYASAKRRMPDGKEMSFGGDTKAALAFLRQGKRVMDAMAGIRAERMPAPKVDADKELAYLDAAFENEDKA